jgi:hypothetical protein
MEMNYDAILSAVESMDESNQLRLLEEMQDKLVIKSMNAASLAEVRRRVQLYESGEATTLSAEEVFQRERAKLKK